MGERVGDDMTMIVKLFIVTTNAFQSSLGGSRAVGFEKKRHPLGCLLWGACLIQVGSQGLQWVQVARLLVA